MLHRSAKPRLRAGAKESFTVRLPADLLKKAGIDPPAEAPDPAADLGVLQRSDERARKLETGLRDIVGKRLKASKGIDDDFETSFLPALKKQLSTVPPSLINPARKIEKPDEIEPRNRQAVQEGLAGRFQRKAPDRVTIRTRFHLTAAQKARLDQLSQNGQKPLTRDEIRRLLLDSELENPPVPAVLVDEPALLKEFLERTHQEKCSEEHLGIAVGEPHPGPHPNGDQPGPQGPFEDADVALAMARLLGLVTPPERPVSFSAEKRPDQETIQATIDAFSMRPGPADVPALFDFHRLEIAFDHVWQEVFADNVVDVARELHARVREMGGDTAVAPGADPLRSVQKEIQRVERFALRPGGAPRIVTLQQEVDAGGGGATTTPPSGGGGGFGGILDGILDEANVADNVADVFSSDFGKPSDLLKSLQALLMQSHPFTVYGAEAGSRSVNFGIVVTYRQQWVPVTYQAGRLVKTIPLAPGESRRVTRKTVVRRKRAEREVEKASSIRRDELTQTSRAESEIVRKAMAKTNFSLTTEGTYNLGIAKGDSTTKLGRDGTLDSSDTKKDFREAVIKASQEYSQERTTEVTTEVGSEFEEGDTSELVNKNDELHVTYMLYELQRRYRISERIHRATPVVLVAQEVPNPSQITDAWLLAHDWVLRRVLLDDSFRPALDYLSSNVAGDRLALDQLKRNVDEQRAIVRDVKSNLVAMESQAGRRYEALLRAIEDRIKDTAAEEDDSFFTDIGQSMGILEDSGSPEAVRMREEAARDAEQRAVEKAKELAMRLQREVTALNEITEKYARLLSEQRNREVQIARLCVHVARNILYYMQAIWAFEVPDQRFLRLHQTKVPLFRDGGSQYRATGETSGSRLVGRDGTTLVEAVGHEFEITPQIQLEQGEATLAEVAHLDDLLGVHGNYLIFPLKEPNAITEFMLSPYVDAGWQLMDPDDPAGLSLTQFAEYVCYLHERLTEQQFKQVKPKLKERYEALLQDPQRQGEEIIVPSDSLFIEALPGAHPLLEDFKLIHRAQDVKMAQLKVREGELENLRLAKRLLEGVLADPEVEKQIVISGDGADVIVPPDA